MVVQHGKSPFFGSQVKMIEGSDNIRESKCTKEIYAVLERYDCLMVPFVEISPGRTRGGVKIIAKKREKES